MSIFSQSIDKINERKKLYPIGKSQSLIIYALDLMQRDNGGYINEEIVDLISKNLQVSRISIQEVITFYSHFRTKKPGKNCIKVCNGISCFLKGSNKIIKSLEEKLNIKINQTTKDGKFTLEETECIAACTKAPALIINDDYYENLSLDKIDSLFDKGDL